ncbi:hypothetical protein DEIGR_101017 [Deinococcus grandis]|uniref:Uncharacterized protein n=1 Tax=Deinococcus grandis TaxID=57498 RepID=A0A100HK97_9DEIO|nr:hypothetical protein DEGR_22550 [Deinococcus grandis]GAQ20990.1 hypothetical protein DEIGR_101017 [Deinococcus grandis]
MLQPLREGGAVAAADGAGEFVKPFLTVQQGADDVQHPFLLQHPDGPVDRAETSVFSAHAQSLHGMTDQIMTKDTPLDFSKYWG